jgi:hypothetical protein
VRRAWEKWRRTGEWRRGKEVDEEWRTGKKWRRAGKRGGGQVKSGGEQGRSGGKRIKSGGEQGRR